MATPLSSEVTALLEQSANGDREALDRLIPLISQELHRLAKRLVVRENRNHTLPTTALIPEAYLRLTGPNQTEQSRVQFFAVAAQVLRHVLVDYARRQSARKRSAAVGCRKPEEPCETQVWPDCERLIALDEVLDRLAAFEPRRTQVFELRVFGGLSDAETAQFLGISARTVRREFSLARAWLRLHMAGM